MMPVVESLEEARELTLVYRGPFVCSKGVNEAECNSIEDAEAFFGK